jgi:glycosyltransferase involved in cell wall biosynthesis
MSEVSLLVAVYNSEKYLRACLDSLIRQTLADIQIVCIDDASTDSSPYILQEYAAADNRIQIITLKTNVGQAKARNEGLKVCNGRTITMVDSDDWLSDNALKKAMEKYDSDSSVDSVLFTLRYHYDEDNGAEQNYPMRSSKRLWSGQEAFIFSLDWSIHGLYITSAELYKKYPFDDTCRLYSDDNTTRLHYLHSGKVALCEGVYFYRQHSAEMTRKNTMARFELIEANLSLSRKLEEEKVSFEVRSIFESERWKNLVGIYCRYLQYSSSLDSEQKISVRGKIAEIYKTIDQTMLPKELKRKFGFIYFRSFTIFQIEIGIYYTLRILCGRGFEK